MGGVEGSPISRFFKRIATERALPKHRMLRASSHPAKLEVLRLPLRPSCRLRFAQDDKLFWGASRSLATRRGCEAAAILVQREHDRFAFFLHGEGQDFRGAGARIARDHVGGHGRFVKSVAGFEPLQGLPFQLEFKFAR